MKIQILGLSVLVASVTGNLIWADEPAKATQPAKPVAPVTAPAASQTPKTVKPRKDSTPITPADTATKAPVKTPVTPADTATKTPVKTPAASTDTATKTPTIAPPAETVTALVRKIDRYSMTHSDCVVWSNGTITIDFDTEGVTGRVGRNVTIGTESMKVLNARIDAVRSAEWVDHRGLFTNSQDPNDWGVLYQAGDKAFYSLWGAIWIGGRDSEAMLPLKHFLDQICIY